MAAAAKSQNHEFQLALSNENDQDRCLMAKAVRIVGFFGLAMTVTSWIEPLGTRNASCVVYEPRAIQFAMSNPDVTVPYAAV